MTSDRWRTLWLFRMLDYQHYDVFHRDVRLGQVIVNSADRSIAIHLYDDVESDALQALPKSYHALSMWLRDHEK